jgi:signal transduction histidine kinase
MIGTLVRRSVHYFKVRTGGAWQRRVVHVSTLGTAMTLTLLTVSLVVTVMFTDNLFAQVTWPQMALAAVLGWCLYAVDKRRSTIFTGPLLILLYITLGVMLMFGVGVGAGAAIVLSSAVILASALYGLWIAIVPTLLCSAALVLFRIAELNDRVHPTYIFVPVPASFSTVVALIFLMHVLWVACGVVHHYLLRANQRLQLAEAEKFQHLYRFAEIGEITTALVHDLANTISSLSLDVENLKSKGSHQALIRVEKKVKQLGTVLTIARKQLNGRHGRITFTIAREVSQAISSLEPVAQKAHVSLDWTRPPVSSTYFGERALLQQALVILIKNAIDSYDPDKKTSAVPRQIAIRLTRQNDGFQLTITDWGRGIKPRAREHIFEPFYSTKKDGMGMGLYLAKRFIEDSFGGSIAVRTSKQKTVFSVNLPKSPTETSKRSQ